MAVIDPVTVCMCNKMRGKKREAKGKGARISRGWSSYQGRTPLATSPFPTGAALMDTCTSSTGEEGHAGARIACPAAVRAASITKGAIEESACPQRWLGLSATAS
jgi:hypothetical protein